MKQSIGEKIDDLKSDRNDKQGLHIIEWLIDQVTINNYLNMKKIEGGKGNVG